MSYGPRWTKPETDFLERLAGDMPCVELAAKFRTIGKRRGWPPRSERAISQRLNRISLPVRARHGVVLTTGGVGELLGCPGTRVEAWLRRKDICDLLQPRWVGRIRYIERKGWRRLARQMPKVLGGFDADRLFLLLEDRELADSIASRYKKKRNDWRIRCVETGKVYENCRVAADAYHVTQACISLAVREGRPVGVLGLTFKALSCQ